MRRSVQGVHQLAQAVRDFTTGEMLSRAVDENGEVMKKPDGTGDVIVSDAYLRQEFPPPGKARARSGGSTPTEQLKDRQADLSEALDRLHEAFKAVTAVTGNDGSPLVEVEGLDPQFCTKRRELLSGIGDELNIWSRTYRRRHGTSATRVFREDLEGEDEDDGMDSFEVEDEEANDSSDET